MPPVRRSKPTYVLSQVRQLLGDAIIGPGVVRRTRQECGLVLEREVKGYIRACVGSISLRDFAYSEKQEYKDRSIFADVYGLKNEDGQWFIKFYIEAGQLTICSCHGPDLDLDLADGRKIRST